jgi:hypothetical protein
MMLMKESCKAQRKTLQLLSRYARDQREELLASLFDAAAATHRLIIEINGQVMNPKERMKRGKDDLADMLARAHTMHPGAADPFQEIFKELEAEGIYGETELRESEEIGQDRASAYDLLKSGKIDPEEANRLSDVIDARQEAFKLRLAERLADKFGGDAKEYLNDADDEK